MSGEDQIHDFNAAVRKGDIRRFMEGVHPDAVWEHNIGTGSPEEGVYQGRDEIGQLFERILETWEWMRPEPAEIREVEPGVYLVRGELHCKHPASETVIVDQYEQRMEVRDGLLAKGRMVSGSTTGG